MNMMATVMSRLANNREDLRSTDILLIAVPESRRTRLFQDALASLDCPPARVVSFTDLLSGRVFISDYVKHGTTIRIDSPGKDFETERALLSAGADEEDNAAYARLPRPAVERLEFERGRILYPRQWYLGFVRTLRLIESQLSNCNGFRFMNSPSDIALMFDKPRCQQALSDCGIPTPISLGEIGSFADLRERMRQCGCARVFIKLAHGSSASGVVAYQTTGDKHQALTTVEMVSQGNNLCLYNSRRIRVHREIREIEALVDALCRHRVYAEQWLPKAGIDGKTFDLRVVVIAGRARHTVVRLSRHPITNLQLLGGRGSVDRVRERIGKTWETIQLTCERVMRNCFHESLYAGIDVGISSDYRRHSVLEVNAFGDLLPEVLHEGLDTYASEISMIADAGLSAKSQRTGGHGGPPLQKRDENVL